MANYSWTINGAAYPNNNSLNVKEGERVEIVMRNDTGMLHPMHLHGHDFQGRSRLMAKSWAVQCATR